MKLLIAVVTLLVITVLGVGGSHIALMFSDLANDLRAPSVAAADADGPAPELGDPAAPAGAPSGDHIAGHIELLKEDGESAKKVLEEVFSEQIAHGSFRFKLEPTPGNAVVRLTGSAASWDSLVFQQFDQLVCALFVPTSSDFSSPLPARRSSALRRYHLASGDLQQALTKVTELLQEELDTRKMAVVANFQKKTIYVAGPPGALVRIGPFLELATGVPATSEQAFGVAGGAWKESAPNPNSAIPNTNPSPVREEARNQPKGPFAEASETAVPDEAIADQPNAADPRELAQDYREIERRAARLAAELRQSRGEEGEKTPQAHEARSVLKGAVEAAFEARERWQLAELALLRSRLERLEQGVRRRAQARVEIIARRVQELLESEFLADTDVTPADISPINSQGTGVRPGSFPRSSPASSAAAPPLRRDTVTTSVRESLLQKLTAAEVELELERASVTAQREAFERAVKEQPAASQKQAEGELEGDPRVAQLRQQIRELETTIRVRPADSMPAKSSQRKLEELEPKLVELKAKILPEIQEAVVERALIPGRVALAKAEESLRQRERVVELLRQRVFHHENGGLAPTTSRLDESSSQASSPSNNAEDIARAVNELQSSLRVAEVLRQKLAATGGQLPEPKFRDEQLRRAAAIWMTNEEEAYERASATKRPLLIFADRPMQSLDSALEREAARAWIHSKEILDLLEASFVAVQYTVDVSGMTSVRETSTFPKVVIVAPRGTTIAQFAPFQYDDRFLKLLRKIAAEYDTRASADAPSPANSSAGKAMERQELVRTNPGEETSRSPLIEPASDPREKLIEADEAVKQAEVHVQRARAVAANAEHTHEQIRRKALEDPSQPDLLRAEEGKNSAFIELEAAHSAVARSRRHLDFARENLAARVRLLEIDLAEAELRSDDAKSAAEFVNRLFEEGNASQSKYSEKILALKRAELDYERVKIQLDLYRKTLSESGENRPGPADAAVPFGPPPATAPDSKKAVESEKNADSPASQKPAQSVGKEGSDQSTLRQSPANRSPPPFKYDKQGYTWLRGIVSPEPQGDGWQLQYTADPSEDDNYGGSLRIVGSPEIEKLRNRDVVIARGRIDPTQKDAHGKPLYRVQALQHLSPRVQGTIGHNVFMNADDYQLLYSNASHPGKELAEAEARWQHRVQWSNRVLTIFEESKRNLDKARRAARTDRSKVSTLPKFEEEHRLADLQLGRAQKELASSRWNLVDARAKLEGQVRRLEQFLAWAEEELKEAQGAEKSARELAAQRSITQAELEAREKALRAADVKKAHAILQLDTYRAALPTKPNVESAPLEITKPVESPEKP